MSKEIIPGICAAPWTSISLRNNNEISVCANSTFSFIVEQPARLSEVLNSQPFQQYRTHHQQHSPLPTCSICYSRAAHGLQTLKENYGSITNAAFKSEDVKTIIPDQVTQIDVNLSNICNLKCRMCSFTRSSTWKDDQLELSKTLDFVSAPVSLKKNIIDVDVDAFPNLQVLVLKGGEPFFDKSAIELLTNAINTGIAAKVNLTVFTNGVHIEKHLHLLREFKRVNLFFSFEGTGTLYSYIRGGTHSFEEFKERVLLAASYPNIFTRFMYTPQAYNLFDLPDAVDFVWNQMNPHFVNKMSLKNLESSFGNILINPSFLSMTVLPEELKRSAIAKIQNSKVADLNIWKNVISYMNQKSSEEMLLKFLSFTKHLDRIRTENIFSTVPEFDRAEITSIFKNL
jgi:hypothetical protein